MFRLTWIILNKNIKFCIIKACSKFFYFNLIENLFETIKEILILVTPSNLTFLAIIKDFSCQLLENN